MNHKILFTLISFSMASLVTHAQVSEACSGSQRQINRQNTHLMIGDFILGPVKSFTVTQGMPDMK